MATKREDLIRLLEAELDLIEGGGYERAAGEPGQDDKPIFYHGIACINHWLVPGHKPECHDDCILLDAVPEQHRTEGLPCHFIPLNDAGDTVASLEPLRDRERLEEEVKNWLRTSIRRLKDDQSAAGMAEVEY
ncbi:MAG TPA: hypothetical protein VN442_23505 [Bryobacteraceae bacterium]|nr:hypothetical protein [Bryobacteraceae bacterium]